MMSAFNWKTTLGGIVTLLAGIVPQFGRELPQDIQVSIIAVGMFIVPYFDTPALAINGSVLALVLVSISLSIAAVGLSTLIAVSSTLVPA